MKLQKQLSRKVNNKEYNKFLITIPPYQIRALKWKGGMELESKVNNSRLIIRPKKELT